MRSKLAPEPGEARDANPADPGPSSRPRWEVGAMLGIVALYCVLVLRLIHANVDDQFMLYRYAANLAHGDGLTYSGGVRVEGATTFLYVVVLAGLFKVFHLAAPVDPSRIMYMTMTSKAVGLACGIGTLYYLAALLRRVLRLPPGLVVASLLSLVLCADFTYSTTNGLETGMVILLYTGMVTHAVFWAEGRVRKHLVLASALACALILSRADGFTLVGAFVGSWLLMAGLLRRRDLRVFVKDAVVLAGPAMLTYAAFTGFRRLYFGRWFPQSYYVKVYRGGWDSVMNVRDFWGRGPHTMKAWERVPENIHWYIAPAVTGYLVAAVLLAGYVALSGRRTQSPAAFYLARPADGAVSPLHALLVAAFPIVPMLVYVSTVGDWMPGHRLLIQFLPPAIALLAGAGLRFVWTSTPTGRARAGALAGLVFLFPGTAYQSERYDRGRYTTTFEVAQAEPTMETYPEQWFAILKGGRDLDAYFTVYRDFWADLAGRLSPGDTVALYESGYASLALGDGTKVLDLSGLNDQRMSEPQDGEAYQPAGRTYYACQDTEYDPKGDYIVAARPKYIIFDTFQLLWCDSGFPVRLYQGRYRYTDFPHNALGFFSVYVPKDASLEFHATYPNLRCSPACEPQF